MELKHGACSSIGTSRVCDTKQLSSITSSFLNKVANNIQLWGLEHLIKHHWCHLQWVIMRKPFNGVWSCEDSLCCRATSWSVWCIELMRIKVERVSSSIRTLRMFLIVFIALNPRSPAAVDGLIVNINLTNIMMFCKLSGVSAIRLQKVSNGARRFFFVSRSFISGHSSTIFCMQSLPSMSAKCWHSEEILLLPWAGKSSSLDDRWSR